MLTMIKRTNDVEQLKSKEVELERQLNEIRQRRLRLEKRSRQRDGVMTGRPLRDLLLDMLQEAQCPLNSLLLASLIRPLHGRNVPSTRFGTLSNDETSSFDSSRPRPVYLCHCLTYDQGQAVKRFWARSDWPLPSRIMGPMTGRLLFLKGAAWTVDLARSVDEHRLAAIDADMLKFVAADQARNAGLPVKRGDFPYDLWRAAISAAIERHEAEDRDIRDAAAMKLVQNLSEREQLFGARPGLVALPGSTDSWRSAMDER